MKLLFVVLSFVSTLVIAGEGREQWVMSDEKEKVEILKTYREWFKEVADNEDLTQDEWEEQSSFWRNIISNAWASEQFNCSYGGWPSLRAFNGCGIPLKVNPDYPKDACAPGQMACQPLLFGNGLCVSVATRKERKKVFQSCETASTAAGQSDESILASIEDESQEAQLLSLLDFADGICASGSVKTKDPCTALSERVDRLRVKWYESVLASVSSVGEALNGCNNHSGRSPAVEPIIPIPEFPLLTPQGLIDASLSEPLEFVDRVLFTGSEKEKSCVFQNSQVYVVYDYCSPDGTEGEALGMKIFSRSGGMIEYYVENSAEKGAVSKTTREDYDRSWRTSFIPTPSLSGNPTAQEINSIYEGERNYKNGYCNAGGMLNIPAGFNVGVDTTSCRDIPTDVSETWLPAARSFLSDPGEQWYQLQQTMRKNVQGRR